MVDLQSMINLENEWQLEHTARSQACSTLHSPEDFMLAHVTLDLQQTAAAVQLLGQE